MPVAQCNYTYKAAGIPINKSVSREADGGICHEIDLPAGKAGQLTARTDDETGTLTMAADHGITTGAIIDLFWTLLGVNYVRYGVLVGTVAGTSVPIGADDSGAGDVLPVNLTNIVACVQVSVNVAIDGDALKMLGICLETTDAAGKGHVDMLSDSPATIEELDLLANVPRTFDIEGGDTNVFTGDPIVTIKASNGSSTAAATLKIAGVQDSTP